MDRAMDMENQEMTMDDVTIRIQDDGMIGQLAVLASAHNRSVEEEALALLDAALKTSVKRQDLYSVAKAIAAMTPAGVKQTDSVEILREMRGE